MLRIYMRIPDPDRNFNDHDVFYFGYHVNRLDLYDRSIFKTDDHPYLPDDLFEP